MVTAKSVDSSKPNYIVVFKEASERNTRTMSSLLNRTAATGVRAKAEHVTLLRAGESGVMSRVYEGIGVAAADLTDEQADALRKREDVAVVAINQVRFLPPVIRSQDTDEVNGGGGGSPFPWEPVRAYLMGVRDTAGSALGFLGGEAIATSAGLGAATAVAPALEVAATARATWGLKAMGVTHPAGPTGRNVKVAVLDTGIDFQHRDMGTKTINGQTAKSFVDNVTVQDVSGHGTHCAGTVAGPKRSVSGIRYGVAPDAQLLVGKVFNNRTRPQAFDDDILVGIQWAEENGARVISMSLGMERNVGEPEDAAYEQLASVLRLRSTNSVLIVAAAGNESDRPFSTSPVGNPAACRSIVAVAAVDRDFRVAPFSCAQMDDIGEVNLSAPGVGVFSSTTGDTFEVLDGTSMATPHIAGLAALILEGNAAFTAQQVLDRMVIRARGIGDIRDFGAGFARL